MRLVGNGAEPEGDPPAEEADHDRDTLAVDEPRGVRERVVGADEVEHRRVRARELIRRGRLLGAELERAIALLGSRVADVHGRVSEQPEVLDPELAEPAGTEDEGPRARPEPVAGMLDRSVGRQASASERRRLDGVEVADRIEVTARRYEHELGVAAVLEHARLERVRADHLLAALTEAALSATPRRVDEGVAELLVLAHDLVSEHD